MARPRILLVDDDADVRRAMGRLLSREFEVTLANGADQALATLSLRAGEFELVLTDFQMEGRDGLSLLGEIRDRWPRLRRILMSGDDVREPALSVADAFLPKASPGEEILGLLLRMAR